MPTLDWIGKDKVINHHLDVPYRVFKIFYGYRNNILDCIKKRENVSNVIDDANIIAAIMLLLLQDVTDLNVKGEE